MKALAKAWGELLTLSDGAVSVTLMAGSAMLEYRVPRPLSHEMASSGRPRWRRQPGPASYVRPCGRPRFGAQARVSTLGRPMVLAREKAGGRAMARLDLVGAPVSPVLRSRKLCLWILVPSYAK